MPRTNTDHPPPFLSSLLVILLSVLQVAEGCMGGGGWSQVKNSQHVAFSQLPLVLKVKDYFALHSTLGYSTQCYVV